VRSDAPLVFGMMLWEIESPTTGATVTSIWMKSDSVCVEPLIHHQLQSFGTILDVYELYVSHVLPPF
jgi:hypothetical protein